MKMSAHYSRYPFPTAREPWRFLAVPKSHDAHQTLCVSAWKGWALFGNLVSASRTFWKLCRHHPVPRGCGSLLLEEVRSSLLILCIPNPASAGEMSMHFPAMRFRQLFSGSLSQGTLWHLVLVPRSMEGSKMPWPHAVKPRRCFVLY